MNKSAKVDDTGQAPAVLGLAANTYWERAAAPPLQRHFACTWIYTAPPGMSGSSVIVPDGCADLLWAADALRIAGPDRRATLQAVEPGMTVVGLRFRPGAAYHWLGTPLSELVEARLLLENVLGDSIISPSAWIREASSPVEIARRLETVVANRLGIFAPAADAIPEAICEIMAERRDYAVPIVRRLCERIGLSARTLQRRCGEAFGYGPKTLDRILRFQRFLGSVRLRGAGGMAERAIDAGYCDQAHLTREARRLAGMTPAMILRQFGEQRQ